MNLWLLAPIFILMTNYSCSQEKREIKAIITDFNLATDKAFLKNVGKANLDQSKKFLDNYGKSLIGFRTGIPEDTLEMYFNCGKELVIFERRLSGFCEDYFIKVFILENEYYAGQAYEIVCAEKFKARKKYKITVDKMKKLLENRGQISNWKGGDCFYVMTRYKDGKFDTELLFQCEKVYND